MYDSSKKKVRGSRRKCNSIIKRINALTTNFPVDFQEESYWHVHLPAAQGFIDGNRTPGYVRRQVIQALVDSTKHLYDIKPRNIEFCKVVLVTEFDSIFDSQIIVFFSEDYYNNFFIRDSENQKWTLLQEECERISQWIIKIPDDFCIKGYLEEIIDEDYHYLGKLWFIGELDS
jgi:hypothetical protein